MTLDDFKLYLKQEIKPKRYKFYSKGNKDTCSLLTRIRVGGSFLTEHSFSIKCNFPRANSLHYICVCPAFTEQRNILLTKMEELVPKFRQLSKKRQFEILIHGYQPEDITLDRINTKIMFITQNFIYNTKCLISSK